MQRIMTYLNSAVIAWLRHARPASTTMGRCCVARCLSCYRLLFLIGRGTIIAIDHRLQPMPVSKLLPCAMVLKVALRWERAGGIRVAHAVAEAAIKWSFSELYTLIFSIQLIALVGGMRDACDQE